jgi:GTP-binding protein
MSEKLIEDKKLEKLFTTGTIEFVAGAANIEQIPNLGDLKEFAFVGRSNVGKSSLVNSLTSRKKLARISSNPGCTRQLNFFNINKEFILVDLPGYGYAKISKAEKQHWQTVIMKYLRGRISLKRIFLLIDARHGFKENDNEIMNILNDCGIIYQIIFTKVDKISRIWLEKLQEIMPQIYRKNPAMLESTIYSSSNDLRGIKELRYEIYTAN